MKNVMVFSCGSIPGIDINFALRGNNEYKIYGASSYEDHGTFVYENYIGDVPFIYEYDFIPKFNKILEKYKIDFIIPLHEDMILFFQEHIDEINAVVISSCYETAVLCRYKSKTYDALKGCDFIPAVYKIEEVLEYPVFVKKDDDQGARHAYRVDNVEQLTLYASQEKMIICEYLPGEEVTVDCFTDRHGRLRFVNPRAADRMLAGIDVHARRLVNSEEIKNIAFQINDKITFRGPWFFQVKQNRDGKFKLLEIASRFAGGFALTLGMDINTPLMAIRDFDNKEVTFDYNDGLIEADKMFITRYKLEYEYDHIIIDGIQTLDLNDKTNPLMMLLIYQTLNENKRITLLSNNFSHDNQILRRKKIDNTIFEMSESFDGLTWSKTVFISKNEERRNKVRQTYGVKAYEPNMTGVLLNWKA